MRKLIRQVLRESIQGPVLRTILEGSTQDQADGLSITLSNGDTVYHFNAMYHLHGHLSDLYEALYHDAAFPRPDIISKYKWQEARIANPQADWDEE